MTSRSPESARRAAPQAFARVLFASPALLAVLFTVLLGAPARAEATIYKCVDEHGRIEFTDSIEPGRRGCKPLDLPGTIPAPPPRAATPGAGRPAAPATAPAAFPKVGGAQQKARDDDRREILNDELRNEEKKLAEQRREFNNGEPERQGNERNFAKYQERVAQMRDNIGRTEKNIDALRREIANVK